LFCLFKISDNTKHQTKMQENTAITVTISAIVAAIAFAVSYGCQQVEQTKRDAIKAGLVERILPGSSSPVWAKPE